MPRLKEKNSPKEKASPKEKSKSVGRPKTVKGSNTMPELYSEAVNVMKCYVKEEGSLRTLVYAGDFKDPNTLFKLLSKLIENRQVIKTAIAVSRLLIENPKFNLHLAEILTAQLLCKGRVTGSGKLINTFKEYQEDIRKNILPLYVRMNTLVDNAAQIHNKLRVAGHSLIEYVPSEETYDDFLKRLTDLTGSYYLEDYHIPQLLIFPPGTQLTTKKVYKNHAVIMQDKGSCLPVRVSSIKEGSGVIDACASPGNTASMCAAKMNNTGKVIAVERNKSKFMEMKERLENMEVSCVTPLYDDFTRLKPTDYKEIEFIFVEPVSSSSGTTLLRDEITSTRLESLAASQVLYVKHALSFPNVNEVIYSTTSVYVEENEAVVRDVLKKCGTEFELADLSKEFNDWKTFGRPLYNLGAKCLRTNVDDDKCNAVFVAKFVRKEKKKPQRLLKSESRSEQLVLPKRKSRGYTKKRVKDYDTEESDPDDVPLESELEDDADDSDPDYVQKEYVRADANENDNAVPVLSETLEENDVQEEVDDGINNDDVNIKLEGRVIDGNEAVDVQIEVREESLEKNGDENDASKRSSDCENDDSPSKKSKISLE